MALSLVRIASLQSLAERDARAVLHDLLKRRKEGRELSESVIHAHAVKSLAAYVQQERIVDPAIRFEVANYYSAEFKRKLESLWDVLTAASGRGAKHD